MDEEQWLNCTNLGAMVEHLGGRLTQRQARLCVCIRCRQVWDQLTDDRSRAAVEVAERFADGEASEEELEEASASAYQAIDFTDMGTESPSCGTWTAYRASCAARSMLVADNHFRGIICDKKGLYFAHVDRYLIHDDPEYCDMLRDIIGNPFRARPVLGATWLAWNDGLVTKLAQGVYESRALPRGVIDPTRFAVLGDALEEAGCNHADLLYHCRQPGPHVRGCWLLDMILGRH